MVQMSIMLILLVVIVHGVEYTHRSTRFHRGSHSNFTTNISYQPYEVKAAVEELDCARVCSREDRCISFDYSGGVCHMYDSYTDPNLEAKVNTWNMDFTDCDEAKEKRNMTDYASVNGTIAQCTAKNSSMTPTPHPPCTSFTNRTVIQRRLNGTVDFSRLWNDYVNGFGDPQWEFWMGLESIHQLTQSPACLSVYMESMDDRAIEWANYSSFSVGNSSTNYALSIGGDFAGTVQEEAIKDGNNMGFTTSDRDNDPFDNHHCGYLLGPWWHGRESCAVVNMNGIYGARGGAGIYWNGVWLETVIMTIYTN